MFCEASDCTSKNYNNHIEISLLFCLQIILCYSVWDQFDPGKKHTVKIK